MSRTAIETCRHPDGCTLQRPERTAAGLRQKLMEGWCRGHWQRIRRSGKPGPPGRISNGGPMQPNRRRAHAADLARLWRGAPVATISFDARGIVSLRFADRARAQSLAWSTLLAWSRLGWVRIARVSEPVRTVKLTAAGRKAKREPDTVT